MGRLYKKNTKMFLNLWKVKTYWVFEEGEKVGFVFLQLEI